MLPPGKNRGRTTKVSVVKARRGPRTAERRSPRRRVGRRVAGGACRRPAGTGARPARPRARRRRRARARSRSVVAQRHRAASSPRRRIVAALSHGSAHLPADRGGGTGSRRRTRPRSRPSGAPSGVRGVHAVAEAAHSLGVIRPWSTSPARQRDGSAAVTRRRRSAARRRTRRTPSARSPAALRDRADAAPAAVAGRRRPRRASACAGRVALRPHRPRIGVLDLGPPGLELQDAAADARRARRAARSR